MKNEAEIMQAIKDLLSSQTKQLNRQLACEAAVYALIHSHPDLTQAGEEYSAAIDRLAAQMPPNLQRPALWTDFEQAIADEQARRYREN